eukprot:CAMPEP_0119268278 /NCGR_PEP_ID=MMETSP1329-20130426/6109_1 /TAXON_ID=114041 /ORGANISM="Genus nov. species nov., Strain RCC1024" /LENGTH=43 /DNA_ID= /DNA_START= /DNA_END= /DNA_ORIENTATION=
MSAHVDADGSELDDDSDDDDMPALEEQDEAAEAADADGSELDD